MEGIVSTGRGIHHLLLQAERDRQRARPVLLRLLPLVVGLSNLFGMAYAERYLAADPDASSLTFLLFLQATVTLSLIFVHYEGTLEEICRKTRLFPSTPKDRYRFGLLSTLRSPPLLALWSTMAVAMLILFHREPATFLWATAGYAALMVATVATSTAILLWIARISGEVTVLLWIVAIAVAGIIIGTLLFGSPTLLQACLPLVWAAEATRAGANGEVLPAAGNLALLVFLSLSALLIGRTRS